MDRLSKPWVPIANIEVFVQLEPALLIVGLALTAWISYRIFLKGMSEERHRTLQTLFRNLLYHLLLGVTLFSLYFSLHRFTDGNGPIERITSYVGLAVILSGAVVFIKVWRILVFEYLSLSHMKVAFPVLLVNLFTLLLSLIIAAWIGTEIFNIRLAPLLATSAIFSLVLGLALQETLGNLFSGVALQFDKPYEIGDWIEIQSTNQKWVGQVYEISWRATVLIGIGEETITIPNRIMGQSQISNFSTNARPIIRSQIIRLPYNVPLVETKNLLLTTLKTVHEIRKGPHPTVFISDTNEVGIGFKLIYFIDNYGDQFKIADVIFSKCLTRLQEEGYRFASHRIVMSQENELTVS